MIKRRKLQWRKPKDNPKNIRFETCHRRTQHLKAKINAKRVNIR